jgi:hypothetical protein
MSLAALFADVAKALDGSTEIERIGQDALIYHAPNAFFGGYPTQLPPEICDVMTVSDADPACETILDAALPWAPPKTSTDPLYVEHSKAKVHVELIGPQGLARATDIRLGLYGMLPGAEYGLRTHPAEEVFVILAGEVDWMRGDADYAPSRTGDRSFHPSMLAHATRTRDLAFMSVYIWLGDISTEHYSYEGLPASSAS